MKTYNLNTPKGEEDNCILIIIFTEYDFMKFYTQRLKTYTQIDQSRIIHSSVHLSNVPAQGGQLMTVFNLYIECFCNEATHREWLSDLKIKSGRII